MELGLLGRKCDASLNFSDEFDTKKWAL